MKTKELSKQVTDKAVDRNKSGLSHQKYLELLKSHRAPLNPSSHNRKNTTPLRTAHRGPSTTTQARRGGLKSGLKELEAPHEAAGSVQRTTISCTLDTQLDLLVRRKTADRQVH